MSDQSPNSEAQSTVVDLKSGRRAAATERNDVRSDRYLPAEYIGREHGLPSAQVHCVSQSADGCIWIAGPAGLSVYDGARIRTYSSNNGLSCNGLRAVSGAASGEVWAGSDRGLDLLGRDGQWRCLADGDGWPYGMVEAIEPLSLGSAWLGTSSGMVLVERRGDDSLSAVMWNVGWVKSVCREPASSALWCLVPSRGVLRFDGRDWVHVPVQVPAELGSLYAMSLLSDGRLALCAQFGCALLDPVAEDLEMIEEVAGRAVHCALQRRDDLWLGTNSGLQFLRRDGEGWRLRGVGLHDEHVTHLMFDRDQNLWVGSDSNGVHKIGALNRAIWVADRRAVDSVLSIRQSAPGEFVLGTCSGALRLVNQHGVRRAEPISRDNDLQCWDVLADRRGGYWLATRGGLFHQPPGQVLRKHGWSHPVLDNPARCLLQRDCGEIWCGTLAGLVRIGADDAVDEVTAPSGSLGYVYHLVSDGPRIWICTLGKGLWCWQDERIEQFTADGLDPQANIYSVAVSAGGQLAVIANNRILILAPKQPPRVLLQSDGAICAWAIHWEGEEVLWAGGPNGLLEIQVSDGQVQRRLQPFKVLKGWEFTTPRALLMTATDAVCGLGGGLAIVDVSGLRRIQSRPNLQVVEVRSSGDVHSLEGQRLTMPAGNWRLQIDFAPHWYADEHALEYRYRLRGFDDDWVRVDGLPRAEFTSLPAGQFELEVEVQSPLNPQPQCVLLLHVQVGADKPGLLQRLRDLRPLL